MPVNDSIRTRSIPGRIAHSSLSFVPGRGCSLRLMAQKSCVFWHQGQCLGMFLLQKCSEMLVQAGERIKKPQLLEQVSRTVLLLSKDLALTKALKSTGMS